MTYTVRTDWGAPVRPGGSMIGPVSLVVIHHSWKPHLDADASPEAEARAMRSMRDYHVNVQDWDDLGYQFCVFQSGRAYEGRGWRRSGAHTEGVNRTSVGICLVIDGDANEPTVAAWRAIEDIIREGLRGRHIKAGYRVRGHRDYARKSCPGGKVYHQLKRLVGLHPDDDNLPTPPKEEDIMASLEEVQKIVREQVEQALGAKDASGKMPASSIRGELDSLRRGVRALLEAGNIEVTDGP